MKRQILLVSVAVLVNHAVMTWGAGEEAVGLAVSLESRAATTNRAKIGIAEYTSACGEEFLRKVYRTETMEFWYPRGEEGEETWHTEQYRRNWVQWQFDGGEPLSYEVLYLSLTSVDGSCEYTNYASNFNGSSWSGDSGCAYWIYQRDEPQWLDGSTGQSTGYSVIEANWRYLTNNLEGYSGTNFGYKRYAEYYVLTDEFTTPQLLSMSPGGYPAEWQESGDTAHSIIGGDYWYGTVVEDSTAEMKKVQYRFKAVAPAGQRFRIQYLVHQQIEGGSYTNWEASVEGIGTGQIAYYPEEPIEFLPPYTTRLVNGCTDYLGIHQWITLGCSSFVSDDGSRGCGGGVCADTPGSFQPRLSDGGLTIRAKLGGDNFGADHGDLLLFGAYPTNRLFTPAGLEYFGSLSDVEIIRSGGALRQVRAGSFLADIVTLSGTSYVIRFYSSPGNYNYQTGRYEPYGDPFSTGTIAQVGSINHLRLTVNNGSTSVFDYEWSAAQGGWQLTSGGGLRKELRAWSQANLVRTNTVRNAADQIISREAKYYQALGTNGLVLQKRVVNPNGAALTTQWFYYNNAGADGTNYGSVKLVVEPTGLWRRYEYDTNNRVVKEISQFLNAATNAAENLCRVIEYDYTPVNTNSSCERRVEKLLGQEIARQFTLNYGSEIHTIQCATPGAEWTNANNLVTVTRRQGAGEFPGEVQSVLHPDGTMQIYEYASDGYQKTTTVYSGQPNEGKTAIVDGTKTVTVAGLSGQVQSRIVYDVASEIATAWETTYHDELGRPTSTLDNLNGLYSHITYSCCGIESTIDRDGTTTYYWTDALKRQTATTRNGVTATNFLDAAGRVLATVRIGSDGSRITNSLAAYDLAGRITRATNALGGVAIYTNVFDGSGQLVTTNTAPDGGTRVEIYYRDGSLQKLLGTAAFPVRYEYGVEQDGGVYRAYTKEIKLNAGGSDTSEWTKTYTDALGRSYKTVYAAANSPYPSQQSYFNAKGQLTNQVDPDGVMTLYQYNAKGGVEYTAVDLNTNGMIDLSGTDRITRTLTFLTNVNYVDMRRTETYVWTTDGQNTSLRVSTRDAATSGLQSWNTVWKNGQPVTSHTQAAFPGNGVRTVTATAADGSFTVSSYLYGRLQSVIRNDAGQSPLTETSYAYDAHGRANRITDARNGTSTNWFNVADQISGTATPAPAAGQSSQVTTNYFDTSGRIWKITLPDNTSVTNEYHLTGLLKKTYGSRTYPVEYTYDPQGRMKTMKTWQDFADNEGSATTTWNYNAYRGWLDNKVHADGKGPLYTYTGAGRLKSRAWARGVTTWYTNNAAGDLWVVNYSDSTPDVTYTYDRRGRQITIAQSGGTTTARKFDAAGNLLSEAYSGGPLNGLTVTNRYDALLRRATNGLWNGSTWLAQTRYGYDDASRLRTVAGGTNTVAYSYLADSALVGEIGFTNGSTRRMTTSKSYDFLNRLTNIVSSGTGFQPVSYAYQYNSANQRTSVTNADNSRWVYQYDALGQVISGKKYWSDGTPVAGQHFEYAFDDIGNRQGTMAGGDNSGANLRPASYLNNSLNQILSREVPGYVNILGTASNNATVTLWGDNGGYSSTSRKGEYFRGELYANNATGAVWLTITNVAVLNNGANPDIVTNTVGRTFVPKTAETFAYDLDGNLTRDGAWTNVWNGENRRVTIESGAGVPPAARMREQWTHLADGRWIQRIVSTNNGSAYYPAYTNRYVWDGQVLLAVLDHTNGLVMSFMRGLDLSGTVQGAGGVGGVLAVTFKSNGTHFFCYDGNGNVTALVNAANGAESARYEYGPFGETIRMTGPVAKLNPFRFSTQYADDVTGDVKYLFRDYNPSTGRWLNRDPINETGSTILVRSRTAVDLSEEKNPYRFVRNNPVGNADYLGKQGKLGYDSCLCRCGPDLTDALRDQLDRIKAFWDGLTVYEGWQACGRIFNPIYAWDAWDMKELRDYNWQGSATRLELLMCQKCFNKITINGKCYEAGDVNYAMLGKITDLCGYPLAVGQAVALAGKVARNYPVGDTLAFVEYGYNGNLTAPGANFCTPRPGDKAKLMNPDNWKWEGWHE
ncbi:MAG: RHS repeat-associated core domain-containing protein [Verrucomicrobiae bacterium]|nr:RHS repeat-associated core domain-containing protein [Verrucomicrobiae bacterium]